MNATHNGWPTSLLVLALLAGACYLIGASMRPGEEPIETVRERSALRAEIVASFTHRADEELEELVTAVAAIAQREPTSDAQKDPRQYDRDWSGFPRSRFRLTDWVISLDADLTPTSLFRHVQLNVADSYIPPTERQELVALFATLKDKFANLHTTHTLLASREARAALGKAPHVELKPLRGRWARTGPLQGKVLDGYRTDPKDPMVLVPRNGKLVGVRYRDLPATRKIVERKLFVASEVGIALIQWFRLRGLCPAPVAENLLTDLFNETESQRRVAREPITRETPASTTK